MPAYEKFRKLAVCITCGKEREPGRIRCAACLEYIRQHSRDLYHKYKEIGLCYMCGETNDNKPKVYCASCSKRHADYIRNLRHGLCVACGQQPLLDNKYCSPCLVKAATCPKCNNPRDSKKGLCKQCREATRLRLEQEIKNRNAEGKCYYCALPNDNMPRASCLKCTERARKGRLKVKLDCFNAYGGPSCKCCGETILAFLSLDHVNNDGAKQRKEYSEKTGRAKPFGQAIFRLLRNQGYPKGYQVMCMNCNFGKAMHGGECPHERIRREKS